MLEDFPNVSLRQPQNSAPKAPRPPTCSKLPPQVDLRTTSEDIASHAADKGFFLRSAAYIKLLWPVLNLCHISPGLQYSGNYVPGYFLTNIPHNCNLIDFNPADR